MCPSQCRPVEAAEAPSQGDLELKRLREELQSLKHQNAELRGALQDACLSTLQPDAAQYVQVTCLRPQSWQLLFPCLHTAPRIQLWRQAECLLRACTIFVIEPDFFFQDSMGSAVAGLAVSSAAQELPTRPLHIRPSAGQPLRQRCRGFQMLLSCSCAFYSTQQAASGPLLVSRCGLVAAYCTDCWRQCDKSSQAAVA